MRIYTAIFLMTLSASCFATQLEINWNKFAKGQTPTNFHRALAGGGQPGDWKIITDAVPLALTPLTDKAQIPLRNVLAQTSADATDERFPMLIYDGQEFKDFKLTTRFKIVSGTAEQMAGIVFRYQNESNFFVVRASALGKNFRFYKVANGVRSAAVGPSVSLSTNVWHTLTIECSGTRIEGSLDGTNGFKALDAPDAGTIGKIGFWTKSDAVSYFGDTLIDYKPLIPTAQSLVNNVMAEEPRILQLRIYRMDEKGRPKIIASNDQKEIGETGTDAESNAITAGKIFYGRGKGTVSVTMPFRDHNGEPIAAMRVQLKSSLIETQDTAVTRATMILKKMQRQISTADDLMQ